MIRLGAEGRSVSTRRFFVRRSRVLSRNRPTFADTLSENTAFVMRREEEQLMRVKIAARLFTDG